MANFLRFVTNAVFILSVITVYGQAPQGINYQGIARDANGVPLKGTGINLVFEIFDAASGGTKLYSESTSKTTDSQTGIFTHILGSINTASFSSSMNWGNGDKYLQVNINGNTLARQQMMSVPYALYAASAGNVTTPSLSINGNSLSINGGNTVQLPVSPTYSSSANISISSGSIVLNPTSVISGTYGGTGTVSTIPQLAIDAFGRIGAANAYSANVTGDIIGPLQTQTVTGLRGTPVANSTPTTGQVLQFNGSSWAPANVATGGVTSVAGTGPLTGTVTSAGAISMQTLAVAGNYGNAGSLSVPTLTVDTYGRVTQASSYTLGSLSLSGDVTGSTGSNTVTALRSQPLSTITPVGGDVLQYFSTPGEWRPVTGGANTWSTTSGIVYPSNVSSPVAIGTNIATFSGNTYEFVVNGRSYTNNYQHYNQLGGSPPIAPNNSGRIYFDGNKFRVSENNTAYVDLLPPAIWSQNGNVISALTPTNGLAVGGNTLNIGGTNYMMAVNGAQYNSSFVHYDGSSLPSVAGLGKGRIYFDASTDQFMVSEGLAGYKPLFAASAWVKSASTVTLSNNADWVGIGVGAPLSKLDISGGAAITSSILRAINSNAANVSNAVFFESNGNAPTLQVNNIGSGTSGMALKITSAGSNALNATSNAGSYNTIEAISGTTNVTVYAGLFDGGLKVKSKTGGVTTDAFKIANASNSDLLNVKENGFVSLGSLAPTAHLQISGTDAGTLINAFSGSPETALRIHNNDQTNNNYSSIIFSSLLSNAASSEMAKIVGLNANHTAGSHAGHLLFMTREPFNLIERMRITSNGNVGINTGNPGYRLTVLEGTSGLAAIYGAHTNTVANGSAHGVQGVTASSHSLAAGVYGVNTSGIGAGVQGYSSSSGAGVLGISDASGPALKGAAGPSTVASVALLLDNGHIKTTGTTPTLTASSGTIAYVSGSFITPGGLSITGNDITGTVTFSTSATGLSNGDFCRVMVQFAKPYSSTPTVILTPTSDMFGLSYMVQFSNTSRFYITVFRPNNSLFNGPTGLSGGQFFNFNYIVIE